MRTSIIMLAVALAVALGACATDVTASDEYQELESDRDALEQQLSTTAAELAEAQARLNGGAGSGTMEVPSEVAAVLDEWWAANERGDGSIADLYMLGGYHLYGDQRITQDQLAEHFDAPGWTSEWISEPYMIADEPAGRYVVARGVRNTFAGVSSASALTFEIVTNGDGELQIAQTAWLYVHE